MKSVAQEGRKEKPILPNTVSLSTDRKTHRTNLTPLKPAEDFFFFLSSLPPEFLLPFCPSSFFYSFFLPSYIYNFILFLVKIPSSYLSSELFLFPLPSFLSCFLPSFLSPFLRSVLPFLFYSRFPSFTFFFLSPFPTDETIKPGALKRPELDPVRPKNLNSRPVSTGE